MQKRAYYYYCCCEWQLPSFGIVGRAQKIRALILEPDCPDRWCTFHIRWGNWGPGRGRGISEVIQEGRDRTLSLGSTAPLQLYEQTREVHSPGRLEQPPSKMSRSERRVRNLIEACWPIVGSNYNMRSQESLQSGRPGYFLGLCLQSSYLDTLQMTKLRLRLFAWNCKL